MYLAENVGDFSQALLLLTLVTGYEDTTITAVDAGSAYCYRSITVASAFISSLRRSLLTKIRVLLPFILIAVRIGLVQQS